MFNLNRVNRSALSAIAFVLVLICVITTARSYYEPMPLVIKTKNEGSLFDLPYDVKCVAGSGLEGESTYSMRRPGGVCGAEKLVREQADYEII
jgi:hypothetical protein